jgi:hypothetical protein
VSVVPPTPPPRTPISQSDQLPRKYVICKSPRSGSTFLFTALSKTATINNAWENKVKAMRNLRDCSSKYESCGVSLNDCLNRADDTKRLFDSMRANNAALIIQLRLDVIAKAISGMKLFSPREKRTGERVISIARGAINTIVGRLVAARQNPDLRPMIVWYEDILVDPALCHETLRRTCTEIGAQCSRETFEMCVNLRERKVVDPALARDIEALDPELWTLSNDRRMMLEYVERLASEKDEMFFGLWK